MSLIEYFRSDTQFYVLIGLLLIAFYFIVIATAIHIDALPVDRTLIPFTIGFFLFMLVYFLSVLVLRLEPTDAKSQ